MPAKKRLGRPTVPHALPHPGTRIKKERPAASSTAGQNWWKNALGKQRFPAKRKKARHPFRRRASLLAECETRTRRWADQSFRASGAVFRAASACRYSMVTRTVLTDRLGGYACWRQTTSCVFTGPRMSQKRPRHYLDWLAWAAVGATIMVLVLFGGML